MICTHFMHPEIGLEMVDETWVRIPKRDPFCNIGNEPGDGSDCALDGLPCARRVVDTTTEFPEPSADVANRAADEIDFFTLVFKDQYGARVWSTLEARESVGVFVEARDDLGGQGRPRVGDRGEEILCASAVG